MRVLAAEHDPRIRRLLEYVMTEWGHEVIVAGDVNAVWAAIYGQDPPDVVMVDWMMPEIDGNQLCRRIRERSDPRAYIILVTAKENRDHLQQGFSAGADDYLLKPFDARELQIKLRLALRTIELQQQVEELRELLKAQSNRDFVTGLWDKANILDILRREVNRARRFWHPLSIILAHIEGTGRLPKQGGTPTLDDILRETGNALLSAIRSYDSAGRYDETSFLLVLPGCRKVDAQAAVTRIRLTVNRRLADLLGETLRSTVLASCTSFSEATNPDADKLERSVDAALEKAKRRELSTS